MKKGTDFEAYLASFGPVDLPNGAKERILLPALAVANVADKAQMSGSALSLGERVGTFFESLFAVPLRVFALSSLLLAANWAQDGQTPKLSAELAAGRGPAVSGVLGGVASGVVSGVAGAGSETGTGPGDVGTSTRSGLRETVSRGWFIDLKTFQEQHQKSPRRSRRPGPSAGRRPRSSANHSSSSRGRGER